MTSVLLALKRKFWLLLLFPAMAVAVTLLLTRQEKGLYLSESQIATGFATASEGITESSEQGLQVKFDNLLATLRSPLLVNMVAYRLLLHDLKNSKPFRALGQGQYEKINSQHLNLLRARLIVEQKLDSLQLLDPENPEEEKVVDLLKAFRYDYGSLADNLEAEHIKDTDHISVTFRSEDPYLSAFVVNILCGELFRYSNSFNTRRSVEHIEALTQLVNQKKSELDEKQQMLGQFRASDAPLPFQQGSDSKTEQIAILEKERQEESRLITQLQLEIAGIERRLEQLKSAPATAVPAASEGTPAIQLQQELEEALPKKELQLTIARQSLGMIEENLHLLRSASGTEATRRAIISNLERQVESARQEYLQVQEQYHASLNISMASNATIKQVRIGQPSAEPVPSRRPLLAGLAGLAGLLTGFLMAVMLERANTAPRGPADFARLLPLKLLGSVNRVNLKKYALREILTIDLETPETALFREQVRKIRFEMAQSGRQVFLFTSLKPGEGKSTLLEAIAYAFSVSKKSVLVIDTNFSHNSLTRHFEATPRLEAAFSSGEAAEAALEAIVPTGVPHIAIIGCKGGSSSPTEVLQEGSMKTFLQMARKKYDYIFMEGAALNHSAASRELSGFADGVLPIFSAKTAIKEADKSALNFLRNMGDKMTGALLNRVHPGELKD